MSDKLDEARRVSEKITDLDAQREKLAAERNDAVRAALAAGASVAELKHATGLHRQRIYQIRDRRY